MSKAKKYTIITVVYNDEKEIEKTILSVLKQKSDYVEYIVIDGGSSDETCTIIRKYEKDIDFWVSEPDAGVYDAMNKGISYATGEYVCFLNSGDWFEDETIHFIDRQTEINPADIIYGRVNKIVNGKKVGYVCMEDITMDLDDIYIDNVFCHQGMFIQKALFSESGNYDTHYKVLADYDWNLKAYNMGASIAIIPEIIANFQMGGLSSQDNYATERWEIFYKRVDRPDDYLDAFIEHNRDSLFNEIMGNRPEMLKSIIGEQDTIYIWGIGKASSKCKEMFDRVGVPVQAFLDSNPKTLECMGMPVYVADDLVLTELRKSNKKLLICISTEKYEREIIDRLCSNKYNQEQYIGMREIKEKMVRSQAEYYRKMFS